MDRTRVLILVPESAGTSLSGPAIRALEQASALAGSFEVTVATPQPPPPMFSGLRRIPLTRRSVSQEVRRTDAVIASWLPPYVICRGVLSDTFLVADLYDPLDTDIGGPSPDAAEKRQSRSVQRLTALQLRFTDLVLCGSERQARHLRQEIASLDRRDPPPVSVVPFGLPDPGPPAREALALRTHLHLTGDDFIVLWWGSLWRWFDPETAIRAFARLHSEFSHVKLVFTAGPPPVQSTERYRLDQRPRRLAAKLGLLNETVFFLDDWIPYTERHRWLGDADLGLTLHRSAQEGRLAVRARYLDYLWCRLPCVISAGDEMGDHLAQAGLASLVATQNPREVSDAIAARLSSPPRGERDAVDRLQSEYRWSALLNDVAGRIKRAPRTKTSAGSALVTSAAYYARQPRVIVERRALRNRGRQRRNGATGDGV
jgi:glycosyltransferase involved in cell wall biosynthesis